MIVFVVAGGLWDHDWIWEVCQGGHFAGETRVSRLLSLRDVVVPFVVVVAAAVVVVVVVVLQLGSCCLSMMFRS